jgi:hypothetical protein
MAAGKFDKMMTAAMADVENPAGIVFPREKTTPSWITLQ